MEATPIAKVIIGITISLDGFVSDPSESVEALYLDFAGMHEPASPKETIQATGAVEMGRKAFSMVDAPDWDAGIRN